MKSSTILNILSATLIVLATCSSEAEARTAVGLHYHQVVTDVAEVDGFDSPTVGIFLAFSFGPPVINFEFALDFLPRYGFSSGMLQPSIYVLTGSFIYGGIGTGIGIGGGVARGGGVSHVQDSPFLGFRAGVKLTRFEFFGSYRLQKFNAGIGYTVENDELDSVTIGALYRF